MILAYFIYSGLCLLLVALAYIDLKLNVNSKTISLVRRPLLLFSIITFSLIIGLRYDVGIDWKNYKELLEELINKGYVEQNIEFGYLYLMKAVILLDSSYYSLFICIAFLQITFFYSRGLDFDRVFPFLIIYFFALGNFIYSLNIMRQMLAISIIFFGTKYIINKQFIRWLLVCILASFIHKTAIICMPFYFLNHNFSKNKIIFVGALLAVLFALKFLLSENIQVLLNISNLILGREVSIQGLYSQDRNIDPNGGTGLFMITQLIIYSIMIIYYERCSKEYLNYGFYLFFNLTALGIVLFPLVANNILLDRIIYYLGAFKFVTFGFYTHYFICIRKKLFLNIIGAVIVLAFFVNFLHAISLSSNQCSPFQFINDVIN